MIKSGISNSGKNLITQCIKDSSPGSFLAKNAYLKPNYEKIIFQVHNVRSYIRRLAISPTPQKKSILEKILITILQSGCLTRKGGMQFVFPFLFLTLQTIKYEFYLQKVLCSKSSEIRRVFSTQSLLFGSCASLVASPGQSAQQTFPTTNVLSQGKPGRSIC